MAREHHCPNCGPQACNASTSKIHTCGVCAAIWEEDLSAPAVAAPRPAAPAPNVPSPAAPAAKPAPPAAPAPAAAKPAAPTAPPATPAAAAVPPKPAAPAPPPAAALAAPPAAKPSVPTSAVGPKTLTDIVAAAKVKRCPKCTSDGVALPSDFRIVQGRTILTDSQTYRAHEWYADTGELVPSPPAPPKPAATAPPAPKTTPAT